MLAEIFKYRLKLEKVIIDDLVQLSSQYSMVNGWSQEIFLRLKKFVIGGKLIRGQLVLFVNEIYGGKNNNDSLQVAAALELFHSGLLIHDDIIDRDNMRRGQKSIHKYYSDYFKNDHVGESFAICAADICFFTAFQLIAETKISVEIKNKINHLLSVELTRVGFAEIEDVYFSVTKNDVTKDRIIEMYRYKTGRYTFSLPFILGYRLSSSGQVGKTEKSLSDLGEIIGIIFQIKDDQLGILGDTEITGKPVGGDIIEHKKTIYYWYLTNKTNEQVAEKIKSIYNQKNVGKEGVNYVVNIIKKYKLDIEIEKILSDLQHQAFKKASALNISTSNQKLIYQLIEYCGSRNK